MRAGVAGMIKTLADELAPDGIRLNNLVPGRIDTDRVAQLDAITSQKTGMNLEEVQARAKAGIPLGRYGTIDDFGAAGAFPAVAGCQLHHRRHPARRRRRCPLHITAQYVSSSCPSKACPILTLW